LIGGDYLVRFETRTLDDIRALGVVSGAALGLLLATAGFLAWASFVSDERVRGALEDSRAAPWMAGTVDVLGPILPGDLRDKWRGVLAAMEARRG
jgi:hypothetical protein